MKVLIFAKDENMQVINPDAHAQKSISDEKVGASILKET